MALSVAEFASRIRAKYPGQYDELDDEDLARRVIAKFPEYKDEVQSPSPLASPPHVPARVATPTLVQQGITGAEVKRRAAAGEPVVQTGLRRATPSERMQSAKVAMLTGLGEGALQGITAPLDVMGQAFDNPIAIASRIATGGVEATLPLTTAVSRGAEKVQAKVRGAVGVPEGAITDATDAAFRLAGNVVAPGPEVALAGKAGRALRPVAKAEEVLAEEGARVRGGAMEPPPPPPPTPGDVFPNLETVQGVKGGAEKMTPEEIRTLGLGEPVPERGKVVVPKYEPPKSEGLIAKVQRTLKPLTAQKPEVQTIFRQWDREVKQAREAANVEVRSLPKVPDKEAMPTILAYEKGQPTPYSAAIEKRFRELGEEAQNNGLEFESRANYIPQVYKNSPGEVRTAVAKYLNDQGVAADVVQAYVNETGQLPQEVARRLGLNPGFTKQRVFPDYETAIKYGLQPKFSQPAQLAAKYMHDMKVAVANRKLLDGLTEQGLILPSPEAPRGWKPLELTFSPRGLSAEPKLAQMLNGYFRDEGNLGLFDTVVKGVANVSRKAQEITLSAGVPYTQVNFFSMGQFIKELTAGNVKAAVPFLRSNLNGASARYFAKEAPTLQRMAAEGIDIGSRIAQYDFVYKNLADKGVLAHLGTGEVGQAAKAAYGNVKGTLNDAFNARVFASFMPQLYVDTFKNAEKAFLKKGMNQAAAQKAAADTVRAFYGTIENVGRGKGTEDTLSAAFFAPKFRENVMNALINTGKSVTTEFGNRAFAKNRRLLAGMALTYAAYTAANMKLAGHPMWENPAGKEFALEVPTADGTHVFVEFMPSFLAFARNMASGTIATARGDLKTAGQKFGGLFSMPVKITSEILTNRDYFGREIYDDTDSLAEKTKKIAAYAGLQVSHPFIREIIKQKFTQPDKPLYQSLSEAAELPLKFMSEKQINKQRRFELQREQRDAAHRQQLENRKRRQAVAQ